MARHPEDATVREWTDILARVRFGTVRLGKRRTIAGASIKAVAARLAGYADADGSRVRPGVARVALDVELSYDTVSMAITVLRNLGLLRLVAAGAKSGHADRYQLAIPAGLMDEIEVWTPAQHAQEAERLRESNRGRHRAPRPDPPTARPAADAGDLPCAQPSAGPVDNSELPCAQPPAGSPSDDEPALCSAPRKSEPALCSTPDLPCVVPGATHQDLVTTTTHHDNSRSRTDLTVVRARDREQDRILELAQPPPAQRGRCPTHPAMLAGHRRDGRPNCPLCRAGHVPRAARGSA